LTLIRRAPPWSLTQPRKVKPTSFGGREIVQAGKEANAPVSVWSGLKELKRRLCYICRYMYIYTHKHTQTYTNRNPASILV